jgi:hypothetical protein
VIQRVRVWIATHLASNWIESLAVPVATGIMEAQPIALVLLFGALLFTGRSADAPLDMGSIVLLFVGLHWWAMLVRRFLPRGTSEKRAKLLYLAGLPLAAAITFVAHVSLLHNALALVIVGGLILWCWRRAVYRIRMDVYEEQLKVSFIVGFLVLLALVVIAAIDTTARYKGLPDSLSYAFPLFFLSGLVALSFLRLSRLKREYRRQVSGRSQADPTRRWPIALTGLWGIIVVVSLTLAALLFPALQMVFSLLWSAVEAFVGWIISLLAPLFSQQPTPLIRGHKPVVLPPKYVVPHLQPNPVAVIVAVIVLVVVVFLIIWLAIREWLPSVNRDEDEVRERLAVRETLRARQQQRHRRPKGALEALDPTSARAHYRKFLQVMARRGDGLGRQVDETPGEYQTRLLTLMEQTAHGEGQGENAPGDAAILDELTRAYRLERYGGKRMGRHQQTNLQRWVPHLMKRFAVYKAPHLSRLRLYLNWVFPTCPR